MNSSFIASSKLATLRLVEFNHEEWKHDVQRHAMLSNVEDYLLISGQFFSSLYASNNTANPVDRETEPVTTPTSTFNAFPQLEVQAIPTVVQLPITLAEILA